MGDRQIDGNEKVKRGGNQLHSSVNEGGHSDTLNCVMNMYLQLSPNQHQSD